MHRDDTDTAHSRRLSRRRLKKSIMTPSRRKSCVSLKPAAGSSSSGQMAKVCLSPSPPLHSFTFLTNDPDHIASHLSDTERTSIITAARTALTAANFPDTALLVGTGTGSARETVKLCNEAKAAGADYAIVIPPGYFAFAIGKNREALKSYFWEVLDKSEVPVMIYNFP